MPQWVRSAPIPPLCQARFTGGETEAQRTGDLPQDPPARMGQAEDPLVLPQFLWFCSYSPHLPSGKRSRVPSLLQMQTRDQVWPVRAFCDHRLRDWFRNSDSEWARQPGSWGTPEGENGRHLCYPKEGQNRESPGHCGEIHKHPQPCGVR